MKLYIAYPVSKERRSFMGYPAGMPEGPPLITDDKEVFDKYLKQMNADERGTKYYEMKTFTVEAEPYAADDGDLLG